MRTISVVPGGDRRAYNRLSASGVRNFRDGLEVARKSRGAVMEMSMNQLNALDATRGERGGYKVEAALGSVTDQQIRRESPDRPSRGESLSCWERAASLLFK